jgi:hypothetical protein
MEPQLHQIRVAYNYVYDCVCSFCAYSFAYSFACHPLGLEQGVPSQVLRFEYQILPTLMDRCILYLHMKAELQWHLHLFVF